MIYFSECCPQLQAPLQARPLALRRVERRGDLRLRHHHQDLGQEVREGHGRGLDDRAEERSARNGHHGPKSSSMVRFKPLSELSEKQLFKYSGLIKMFREIW